MQKKAGEARDTPLLHRLQPRALTEHLLYAWWGPRLLSGIWWGGRWGPRLRSPNPTNGVAQNNKTSFSCGCQGQKSKTKGSGGLEASEG